MTGPEVTFREATAERRIQAVPLAHLSIELGHLYFEDLMAGPDRLRPHFQQVAHWVAAARQMCEAALPAGRRARVSTCFLVDDYFSATRTPAQVVPELIGAARESGLEIDYLARESGCAEANGVPLARLVEERIVADPPSGANGARPPVTETGWLCNGQRSPAVASAGAMGAMAPWQPPAQNAARGHSVFVDVELWQERAGSRTWSCAFLAAVWQLLRLGLLRHGGARVAVPRPWEGDFPEVWERLPVVAQLNPRAAPFSGYRTVSVLSRRFLPTEHAVRTILGQVAIEEPVRRQAVDRAATEGLAVPEEPVDRIDYVFAG